MPNRSNITRRQIRGWSRKKLGFIEDKNILSSLCTRPCEMQFTFGNFGGWLRAIRGHNNGMMKRRNVALKNFVFDHYCKCDLVDFEDVRLTLLVALEPVAKLEN